MGWRSVVISQPAYLSLDKRQLSIELKAGEKAHIPVEDISAIVLDCPQLTISQPLLCQLADHGILLLTVDDQHLPNGIFLPYQSYYMGLARLRAQLRLSKPRAKQWQQQIIRQKIQNQHSTLTGVNDCKAANVLARMTTRIKSGDPDNLEGQAAALYFRHAFSPALIRGQSRFYNAAMNYGYAVVRAAIARELAAVGLQPALGLFHNNERNPFNLADDLIEPYRPILDLWILRQYPQEPARQLEPHDKGVLVSFLHQDIANNGNDDLCTVLAHIQQMVQQLTRALQSGRQTELWLASPPPALFVQEMADE